MKLTKYHFNLVAYEVKYVWCQGAATSIKSSHFVIIFVFYELCPYLALLVFFAFISSSIYL